ncbi:MAG: hypothetical protein JRN19_04805 [Nitrososphaerota archaeon]|nr:hypothetical protein [Nitrososphaerota archaeon]
MDEENDEGNIEYKYLLEPVSPEKAQKLVTQLRYRLDEGHGEAFYVLGLMDDGRPIGLSHEKMEKSISNLRMLAQEAGASCRIIKMAKGQHGEIAEIYLRYIKGFLPIELTIALLGNVDAGKSTLKGVLVTGRLDDGNGGAMASVARYIHEIKMRRTSAISTHILGFDEEGDCINEYIQPYNEAEIYLKSSKIISLVDLAGHDKYLKTTLRGIMGSVPDYVILVASLNGGPVGSFREHLGLAIALKVPVILVLTKVDTAPREVADRNYREIMRLLKMPGIDKIPFQINDDIDASLAAKNMSSGRVTPVFFVSNKNGYGLQDLKFFLNLLPKRRDWASLAQLPFMMYVDEVFDVTGVGTVVSGLVEAGAMLVGEEMMVGPDTTGNFVTFRVISVHKNRMPIDRAVAGQYITLGMGRIKRDVIRRGMVIVRSTTVVKPVYLFKSEVKILHHPTMISVGYEPVIQFRTIKEVVKVVDAAPPILRSGDTGYITFKLKYAPAVINVGDTFVFREGSARGLGLVSQIIN